MICEDVRRNAGRVDIKQNFVIYYKVLQLVCCKIILLQKERDFLKNNIKTFSLFIREDDKSKKIADTLRYYNSCSSTPLLETENGDLIIAIGGDGTFLHAVTEMNFRKDKIYVGVHTGTLGFLQNLSENDVYALIKYLSYEKEFDTRKVLIPRISISLLDDKVLKFKAFNEILICGKDYTKIQFSEYVNDELLQDVSSNGIIISSNTGDTAYSMNAGGAVDFSNHFQLVCTLLTPIKNAVNEDFICNSCVCQKVTIVPKTQKNIQIIIDGISRDISSELIKSIEVSMLDGNSYINKLELTPYSKVRVIREKILGYKV